MLVLEFLIFIFLIIIFCQIFSDLEVTVQFYALLSTGIQFLVNSTLVLSEVIHATGNTERRIFMPGSVHAPSNHTFLFQYTDVCESVTGGLVNVYVDEKVSGVSLTVCKKL